MKDFPTDEIHDHIRSAMDDVRSALDDIPESVHAAMGDVHEAMGDVHEAMGDVGFGFADDEPDEIPTGDVLDQVFEVGDNPELTVRTVAGRITVRADNGSSIRVHATKHGPGRARQNTWVQMHREGDRVSVETKARVRGQRGNFFGLNLTTSSVDYDITVPRQCRVNVKGVSADISIGGTNAPVTIQTVSGDVVLQEIAGECSMSSVSGDIAIRQMVGELTIRTTSGDVRIQSSNLRSFILNSVSGDFMVETPLISGAHYMAKTTSGDLHLRVPPGTGATVQLKTISGDVMVANDLPTEIIKSGRRRWQGRINGGGADLEMSSISGDLHVSTTSGALPKAPAAPKSTDWVPTPPTPPTPPNAPADQSPPEPASEQKQGAVEILDALQRGDISVEEAMARLDALS